MRAGGCDCGGGLMSQTAQRVSAGTLLPAPPRAGRASRVLRPLLMLTGIALLAVVAAVLWLRNGGTVSVEDAYIRADKVAVSTDVSGIVAEVEVREGQAVRRGDVLFRLDDRPFRIAVAGAQGALAQVGLDVAAMRQDYQRATYDIQASAAQMQSDRTDYGRFAGLIGTGAVTQAETDQARFKLAADQQRVNALKTQAQVLLARLSNDPNIDPARTPAYQQAEARLDEAQRELDHCIVRAPFDGIATQVPAIQPGMYLGASTAALELVSTEHVWAEGNPKETELTWVTPGDHVSVHVDTYPDRVWNGAVESISPASGSVFSVLPAQNTSGNWVKVVQRIPLRVRIDPQTGAPPLRAGMSVVLHIETGHRRRLSDLLP
jgi:membrane fusion protein (multidrug efflux system)